MSKEKCETCGFDFSRCKNEESIHFHETNCKGTDQSPKCKTCKFDDGCSYPEHPDGVCSAYTPKPKGTGQEPDAAAEKIEDADIVVDLSGGRLACQEYRKRITELKEQIDQLRKTEGWAIQRAQDLAGEVIQLQERYIEAVNDIKELKKELQALKEKANE